ncbi:MAG: nucleotide exchange factor GrpE [Actinobacteria bacterium]|nr:nucleotide exchange factor GrpE [Actinomycetota bacterium]
MTGDKNRNGFGDDPAEPVSAEVDAVDGEEAGPEGAPGESYEDLKERLSRKEADAAEYLDMAKRVQAEMDNYRKRMLREQEQIVQYATQTVMRELLPLIDNIERALHAAEAGASSASLTEGFELIYTQLNALLAKECVEVIDPLGREFDPERHEAVLQVESEGHAENTVIEVLQKGYELKGRLLRPAMVKVAK